MKKIIVLVGLFSIYSNLLAQLEVADTVLLTNKNDIFWGSSSELERGIYYDLGKYGAANLADDNPSTCWAEGSEGDGIGEYILLSVPENTTSLKIRNGYQKSNEIYYANNRPGKIEFTLYATYQPAGYITETHNGFCISEPIATSSSEISDKLDYQEVNIGFNWTDIYEKLSHDNTFDKDQFILKIKITEVYKGNKWNDACISDIRLVPSPYYNLTSDEQGFIKVTDYKTDTLFYSIESIYQVVEISPDAKWVIFIEMPADIEGSRAETIYKLFSIEKEKFVNTQDLYMIYGFIEKEGQLSIEGITNESEDKSIPVNDL